MKVIGLDGYGAGCACTQVPARVATPVTMALTHRTVDGERKNVISASLAVVIAARAGSAAQSSMKKLQTVSSRRLRVCPQYGTLACMMDNVRNLPRPVKLGMKRAAAPPKPAPSRGPRQRAALDRIDNPPGTAAFGKAMRILDLIAAAPQPLRFAQLQAAAGLPRATLHRLLAALLGKAMIAPAADGGYQPGPHLLELASRTWERMDLRQAARAAIERLNRDSGETIHLATLSGDSVVYIDKVECDYPLRLHSAVGKRGPVHCTAVGKVMAAYLAPDEQDALVRRLELTPHTPATLTTRERLAAALKAIRRAGVAFDLEEHVAGIHCVAAPVFDLRGNCVGGISMTAPTVRIDLHALREHATAVSSAAADATRHLGGRPPSANADTASTGGAVARHRSRR